MEGKILPAGQGGVRVAVHDLRRLREKMNKSYLRTLALLLAMTGLVCAPAPVRAGADEHDGDVPVPASTDPLYRRGRISLQLTAGALFAHRFLVQTQRQEIEYVQTNLRFGCMLNTPSERESILRGNFEALFEATYSKILDGFGNYLYGCTALVRYNFVRSDAQFVPYFQVGAGVVYTDTYKDVTQKLIGQSIEFTPQGSVGLRCLLARNWSFDAEVMFHHISNAGLDERNIGVNSFGGFVGFTHFFDKPWG